MPVPARESATSTKETNRDKPEYNPRWKGYVYIILSSLVALSSISNVPKEVKRSHWATTVGISSITFGVSLLILAFDRFQNCCSSTEKCNFTKANDGKLEGTTLLLFVLFWIVGVAILTRPAGLAYYATNIYFSSWAALISCVYTLNKWLSSKDIISIQELTSLSATLKSWYTLFLTSMVCFGSAISMHIYFSGRAQQHYGETVFAITLGLFSTLVALFWILVHYNFFTECCASVKQGGWLELAIAFLMILSWTVGVAILTQENGIAATMAGSGCSPDYNVYELDNCTLIAMEGNVTIIEECSVLYESDLPGSNLYFFTWFALMASVNITLRWKAAQALQFAQAAQGRATSSNPTTGGGDLGDNSTNHGSDALGGGGDGADDEPSDDDDDI